MRQRASTKTQRRQRQLQTRDPYALTGDVYGEKPTFHVGGLVTAAGALQLLAAVALGGFFFSSALLFCALLLGAVGMALLHHSGVSRPHALGLKQTLSRLLALRRGALDYSLTLSIAQSGAFKEQRDLQIAVVPTSPTPQKVVAAMSLTRPERLNTQRKTSPLLAGSAPLAALNKVDMKPLQTVNAFSVPTEEETIVEKPRAKSEPKQVQRSRPLLESKSKQKVDEKKATNKAALKTMPKSKAPEEPVKQKRQQVQAQPATKVATPAPKKQAAKETKMLAALPKTQAKSVLPVTTTKSEPKLVQLKPTSPPVQTVPIPPAAVLIKADVREAPPTSAPVATLPVLYPERKPIVEFARGEPALEQELVAARKVLLYLDPEIETVGVEFENQELEHENELERELERALADEQEYAKEEIAFTMESFPPLSPTLAPMVPPMLAVKKNNIAEPNFLMDITLEPFAKPEKKVLSIKELTSKKVQNADLRAMLDELDLMSLELDAAMVKCTRLLTGEEEKVSEHASPMLEPEEEPIFCC